mgnify:CR=1 FL=1
MREQGFGEGILAGAVATLALAAFVLPVALLGWIGWRGLGAVSWTFLTSMESDFGAAGGVFYQAAGSMILIAAAALVAAPASWCLAVFKEAYVAHDRFKRMIDTTLFTLNSVPSIVFGLFGYLCFVHTLGLGVSWVSGGLILGLMILPTVTVSVAEGLVNLPREHKEAAAALGLNRWQVIRSTLWPASQPFLWTGLTLGLARAAGETAPIFFTAAVFSGVTLPHSWRDPVVTLPTHIMTLAQEAANPVALENSWGAALVLIVLVGFLSGLSWLVRRRNLRISP